MDVVASSGFPPKMSQYTIERPKLQVESHYYAHVLHTLFPSINATVVTYKDLCSTIAQGDDMGMRTGRTIHVHHVSISGTLVGGQFNTSTDEQYNVVHLAIVGASAGKTTFSGFDLLQPQDVRITGFSKYYYDQIITLSSNGRDSTGYLPAVKQVTVRVPVSLDVSFTSTTANTNVEGLYLLAISDSFAVPNPGFENGTVCVEFTDS
jgi:hypothetical protein